MFEDLNGIEEFPMFTTCSVENNPFGFIEDCIHVARDVQYIGDDDMLFLLSKYKMLYDNWFHGDN